jgi:hypothetical protein
MHGQLSTVLLCLALPALSACGEGNAEQRAAQTRFDVRFQGRILGPDGQPVTIPARVSMRGELRSRGQLGLVVGNNLQASEGAFDEQLWWSWGSFDPAHALGSFELQAHDAFCLHEPANKVTIELSAGASAKLDFQLGKARPTVPVLVVDSAGQPVTKYWLTTLTDEDPAPQRWGTFPDGIAELPIPRAPYRVKAHLERGAREAVVGPFELANPPARIEIGLPD